MKLIFCMQINIKVSHKLVSAHWVSNSPPTRQYYHYWWPWSSALRALKVTSLQYLYNISKKKLGMDFIYGMQINVKVYSSWHYCFWWKWPSMFKVPKMGSWLYFCSVLRKRCCNNFCVLLWCKTFRYLTGSSHVCCYCFPYINATAYWSGYEIKPTPLIDALLAFFIAELVVRFVSV